MTQLPEITASVLDQWEQSAQADADAGSVWSVNPVAVLAVVAEVRALRDENEQLKADIQRLHQRQEASDAN